MIPAHRLRSVGWIALIGLCFALFMVLSFRVNALKSEVRLAENRIVALKREKIYLETEFETRASQQQLKAWNDIEFGYAAPTSGQYLEGERQLAALGKPAGPDAPRPIRVASADDSVIAAAAFPAMVSPLSGEPLGEDKPEADGAKARPVDRAAATAALGERLGKVERPRGAASSGSDEDAAETAPKKKAKVAEKPADKPRTATAAAKSTKDARR